MSKLQGAWIWYELNTTDPTGAKAFYEAVVGWTITLGTEPPMNYGFIANADGGSTGGLLPLTPEMTAEGARPAWLGYIGVDDVDATVEALTAAGGKLLMPPADIPMAGRIALVTDCCGAPFYLMTPNMPEGAGPSTCFSPSLPGRCAWNELHADNQQSALVFYTGLFGWSLPEPMDMGPMGKYQFIAHEDVVVGAIMQSPPPHWAHYFRVPDIDAAVAAITAQGGQVLNGPHPVPTGDWVVTGTDPQGAEFALVGARP
jgi:predicted enzyme related to lactoylglutathione lyase